MWKRLSKPWKKTAICSVFFLVFNLFAYLLHSFYTLSWSVPIGDLHCREYILTMEGIFIGVILFILFCVWVAALDAGSYD